jgi:hypothetical protein
MDNLIDPEFKVINFLENILKTQSNFDLNEIF